MGSDYIICVFFFIVRESTTPRLIDRERYQSINQSINPSINQSINQSIIFIYSGIEI